MSTFNIDDRVIYSAGQPGEDTGTVVHALHELGHDGLDRVWVKWDSNGKVKHAHDRELQLLKAQTPKTPFDFNAEALSTWVIQAKPTLEEIETVCKFFKFINTRK